MQQILKNDLLHIFFKNHLHFHIRCAKIIKLLLRQYAAVAQLDRVFGYEPKGRGFESLQARNLKSLSHLSFWEWGYFLFGKFLCICLIREAK